MLLWNVVDHKLTMESLPPGLTDAILLHLSVCTKDIKHLQVSLNCPNVGIYVPLHNTAFCF